jgi:ADP-heptose:LPS heptosyltransferase
MRLGDVALLLPALARLKACYPEAKLTLLTDDRCAALAELCPSLDEVIKVDRLEMRDGSPRAALKSILKLISNIRRRRFDLVVDFLSFRETNLLAGLSGAPYRLGMRRYDRAYLKFCFNLPPVHEDKGLHVSDMFQLIVSSITNGHSSAPTTGADLRLPDESLKWAVQSGPSEPYVTFYVGAPVVVRRWPTEDFARVADFAIEELGAQVAVLAGPSEAGLAGEVRKLCHHPEKVFVFDNLAIPQLAAMIARSRLLLSNDTGPMHIGPAFGVPTLGLFSVGYPEHYRPLGEQSRFLRSNPIERISFAEVNRNIKEMWITVAQSRI